MWTFGQKTAHVHRPALLRYGFAVLSALAAATITAMYSSLAGIPFALSFVAISATAWFAGFYAGLLATALSLALVNYFVLDSHAGFVLHGTALLQTCVLAAAAVFVCAVARQREQKDERLEKVETFFETTLHSIGDALIAVDTAGRVTYLNAVAERMTGWQFGDARGKPLNQVLRLSNSQTGEPVLDPVAKVIESGVVVGLANHTALTSRTGDRIHIEDSAAPIRNGSGQMLGVVLVFHDVSERYEAELKKSQSERSFRSLVESIPEGFESFDGDWNFTYINQHGAAISGHTPEQLMGRNLWEAFSEAIGSKFETTLKEAAEKRVVTRVTDYYAPLDKWIQATAYPTQDGISVLFQDVSEQVKAEEKLRIAERLATAGRLAATVSHEMNNPLAAVSNLLFLAQREDSLEKVRTFIAEAERQLHRASHVAKQTLSFHRKALEQGEASPALAVLDSVQMFQSKLQSRGIRLEQDVEDGITVPIPSGELVQIISNLLSNAVDAAPANSSICLKVKRQADAVLIRMSDAGTGVAEEIREKIFDPFFTTKEHVGTGLGLWVTKSIVERHGGTISVSNDDERSGAVFTVLLPLAKADVKAA